MTIEHLDSSFIGTLNAQPIQILTSGEGTSGLERVITDTIAVTASGTTQTGSSYRLCRFPVYAKVKGLEVWLQGGDSNAADALVYDVNVAFSDSAFDGTQVALQNTIPVAAANGTVTTEATYSTPNKLFGTVKPANTGTAFTSGLDILFNTTGPGIASWSYNGPNLPLWDFFGFVNAQGFAQDPSGYFDLYFRVSTAASTPAAGSITARLRYVV